MCFFHFEQSEQLKPLLSLYSYDTVQNGESRDCARLKKVVVWNLEQTTRQKHFSSRETKLESPLLTLLQPKGSLGQRKARLHTLDYERSMISRRKVWRARRTLWAQAARKVREYFKKGKPGDVLRFQERRVFKRSCL